MKKFLQFLWSILTVGINLVSSLRGKDKLPPVDGIDVTNGEMKDEIEEVLPDGTQRKRSTTISGAHIHASPPAMYKNLGP